MRWVGLLVLFGSLGCRQLLGFESATVADAPPDSELVPDATVCADLGAQCAGELTLRTCSTVGELPTDTTCSWGCLDTPQAHCGTLTPTGSSLTAADVVVGPTLLDLDIPPDVTLDGSTGSISGGVRPAGSGIINGIEFQVRGTLAVFRFKSVAFRGTVLLRGTHPVALVSDGELRIEGVLDARGACTPGEAGPGGSSGGNPGADGNGTGRGRHGNSNSQTDVSGGGGGTYGGVGGKGGDGLNANGGPGGITYGDPQLAALLGGSGGGGGGRPSDGGFGGGGGGALHLVSNTQVRILVGGGINAGGCGGGRGLNNVGGGGGGGSGGAILIEAPAIVVDGGLAANGGGGGGGNGVAAGVAGRLSSAPATGGLSVESGVGGDGGAGTSADGQPGAPSAHGGGGGGGVGWIRLNTRASASLTGIGFISPPLEVSPSTATSGLANVQ